MMGALPMYRIIAALFLISLAACGRNLTDPVQTCVERGDFAVCGRSPGPCSPVCIRYAITCNDPLTLTTKPSDGSLTCVLDQHPTAGDQP